MHTLDYGATYNNPWGYKATGTWGVHDVKTKLLYGIGRQMDFMITAFIREG